MWGWDPSQGEGPAGGTSPMLLPTQSASSTPPPPTEPNPVVVPDVQGLQQQVQNQQNVLAQIKETLRENVADRASKEKKLEMYANKLSQIKNRSKNAQKKTSDSLQTPPPKQIPRRSSRENLASPLVRKASKENLSSPDVSAKAPATKGKMTELKKRLEENKLKFEEQTEREITETRRIEGMVEQLKTQLKERDVTIHELQKTMDTPPSRPKVQTLLRDRKKTRWTQTIQVNETSAADLKIKHLEATIVDLEDTVRQQTSVISSRTQAVSLLTQDLSKKSKTAVDDLEETRLEMRTLQNNFVQIETRMKSELQEKDNRLAELEEKIVQLESVNEELSKNCTTVEAQLAESIEKCIEKENAIKLLQENGSNDGKTFFASDMKVSELENKIEELTKDLDASNKLMIRLKLEHKNKLKAANKSLDLLKKSTNDNGEILRLSAHVEELEAEKLKLQSKIAVLEEEKATEGNLNQRISDLENTLKQKDSEIISFEQLVASFETEKLTWQQCIEDQNILVDNLNSRIQNLEEGVVDFEPFEVPGDGVSRQLDSSNNELQKQIEDLVAEKQSLLNKLKNLPSVSSTDSSTFEKVDFAGLESEKPLQAAIENATTDASAKTAEIISSLEQSLLDEKQKSASFIAKIKELEECIESLGLSTSGEKGRFKGKNRVQKLEQELLNTKKALREEKERVRELCDKLEDKEKLIKEYIEKIGVFERDNEWSGDLSETQRKCLGLENSLLELTEHCERLRKENIEVVHQLSEEKVRHKRVEEELAKTSALVPALQAATAALDERVNHLETSTDVTDFQESLEYSNIVIAGKDTEIFNLQSSLADRGHELDVLREELEKARDDLSKAEADRTYLTSQATEIDSQCRDKDEYLQQLQGTMATCENRIRALDELNKKYAAELQKKSEECSRLADEHHRLQVSLETVMADNAVAFQARGAADEKYSALEKKLKDANSSWEQERNDWQNFMHATEQKLVKERNEALMKSEEAEKVLQKTWAERNELIQSKQDLLIRYAEMEKVLNNVQYEKNQFEAHNRELTKNLEEAGPAKEFSDALKSELELKASELEKKKEDYNNLALKAKKLAANLKKKAQIEKELTEQLNVVLAEKGALAEAPGTEKDIAEKWAIEGSEKQNLLRQKEVIESQNILLMKEKEELLSQNKELVIEKEMYIREAEAAFGEKCAIEEEYMQHKEFCDNRVTSLETERNALVEKLGELEKHLAFEKTECESVKQLYAKAKKDIETAEIRLNGLEQTFELEEKENEALLQQKSALLQERDSLLRKFEEKEESLNRLEKENAELVKEISQLQQTVQFLNQDLANLKQGVDDQHETLVLKCKNGEDRINELIRENETLTNQMQQLRLCLQEADASMETLKDEVNRLSHQQNHVLGEKNNLESKLKTMEEDLQQKVNELQLSHQKVNELQLSHQLLVSEKAQLEHQNAAHVNEMDTCREAIASLQRQLEERNNALNTEIIRSNQVNDDLMNLRSMVAEKETEIQRLTENLAAAEAAQSNAKRKKSVTFKTDDGDYIRELRGEVNKLQEDLSEGRGKIAELEKELVKEKHRMEEQVLVKAEASSPEQLFSRETLTPSFFFSTAEGDFLYVPDPFSEDSLAWDAGWDTEGQLEEAHALSKEVAVAADPDKLFKLENELKALYSEKEKVDEDLRVQQVKYTKVVKKLKEQKLIIDRLQGEIRMAKKGVGGDLDAAMMDELRQEIKRVEARECNARKELSSMKVEKDNLLKRIDMLNAGNERFMDKEVAVWQQKNAALLSEITNLRVQLRGPRPDDGDVTRENRELRNVIEGLEWKISELTELVEEKDEEVLRLLSKETIGAAGDVEKQTDDAKNALDAANANLKMLESQLAEAKQFQISFEAASDRLKKLELELQEAKASDSALKVAQDNLAEMEDQLSVLAAENETLQGILNNQKLTSGLKTRESQPPQILQYFQKRAVSNFFDQSSSTMLEQPNSQNEKEELEKECKELSYQLSMKQHELLDVLSERDRLKGQIFELTNSLRLTEEEMNQLQIAFENERLEARQQTDKILETLALKEAELDASSNYLNLLAQKENEIVILKAQIAEASSASTVAILNEENWQAHDQLKDKEDQIEFLAKQVEELQKAYNDSKSEIERLLNEERLRSETPLEDEFMKRSIDVEKTALETALRAKENELSSLKECLTAAENEVEEARNKYELIVQQLKAQLRQLDKESTHSAEEKDAELSELRSEVTELQDLVATKALEVRSLRDELSSLNKKYEEEIALLPTIKSLLEERDSEVKKLRKAVENLELVVVEKEAEIAELRLNLVSGVDETLKINELQQLLTAKEEEVRALKETLESVHAEMSQFRNFDKQMRDLQMGRAADTRTQSNFGDSSDWNAEEAMELAGRLQSDLDTALYMLHQRDVRCEELTFELMQLLEERDTLQLRLSTVIRTYEELKAQVEAAGEKSPSGSSGNEGSLQHLTDKISELHNVGYARDKNIQDESLQRHREQMALLNRDGRGKNRPVLDV